MDDRAKEVIRMALSYLAADLEAACLNYRLEDENPAGDYMAVDNHTMLRPTAEEVMDLLEQFREEVPREGIASLPPNKILKDYDVTFRATFATTIKVPRGELVSENCCDIEVPESPECSYVVDTFEVLNVRPTAQNG